MIDVYIFGGSRIDYLALQIEMIKLHVKDLGQINYVQGPRSPKPELANQEVFYDMDDWPDLKDFRVYNAHVPEHLKSIRFASTIEWIMDYYVRCPSLFLHGDCVPIDEVTVGLISETGCAKTWNPYCQWVFATPGSEFYDDEKCTVWPHEPIYSERWAMQLYYPCFLHLDDYSTDTDEAIQEKIAFAREHYCHPVSS